MSSELNAVPGCAHLQTPHLRWSTMLHLGNQGHVRAVAEAAALAAMPPAARAAVLLRGNAPTSMIDAQSPSEQRSG